MSRRRQIDAKSRTTEVCSECGNIKYTDAAKNRARKAGNASYLASLRSGELSMSARGKLGGGRRKLTLAERDARKASDEGGLCSPKSTGVPQSILALANEPHEAFRPALGGTVRSNLAQERTLLTPEPSSPLPRPSRRGRL